MQALITSFRRRQACPTIRRRDFKTGASLGLLRPRRDAHSRTCPRDSQQNKSDIAVSRPRSWGFNGQREPGSTQKTFPHRKSNSSPQPTTQWPLVAGTRLVPAIASQEVLAKPGATVQLSDSSPAFGRASVTHGSS